MSAISYSIGDVGDLAVYRRLLSGKLIILPTLLLEPAQLPSSKDIIHGVNINPSGYLGMKIDKNP